MQISKGILPRHARGRRRWHGGHLPLPDADRFRDGRREGVRSIQDAATRTSSRRGGEPPPAAPPSRSSTCRCLPTPASSAWTGMRAVSLTSPLRSLGAWAFLCGCQLQSASRAARSWCSSQRDRSMASSACLGSASQCNWTASDDGITVTPWPEAAATGGVQGTAPASPPAQQAAPAKNGGGVAPEAAPRMADPPRLASAWMSRRRKARSTDSIGRERDQRSCARMRPPAVAARSGGWRRQGMRTSSPEARDPCPPPGRCSCR